MVGNAWEMDICKVGYCRGSLVLVTNHYKRAFHNPDQPDIHNLGL